MEKVCVGSLRGVVLFLLLKPCSSDLGEGLADLEGEHCKVPALFWWQTWVQEMAELQYSASHLRQPAEGGTDCRGLWT